LSSQTRPKYCLNCGTQLAEGERFCPNCGKATRTVIGPDRRTISYILGFFIIGLRHIIVGRYARGIGFFAAAIVLGIILGYPFTPLSWVIGLALWAFQLYDLYQQRQTAILAPFLFFPSLFWLLSCLAWDGKG
jgi:hypothetical protein